MSVKSNWDILNTEQQEMLRLKAKGQLKGEIGFFDSEKAILEKRMTFYDKEIWVLSFLLIYSTIRGST